MDLGLSLPDFVEQTNSDVELRPGKLASWLDSLPILNLVDTSYQIQQALYATNRIRIDEKIRLKLLEAYRQPVATVCEALEKEYIGNSLPLSTKALQSASRARNLQIEMANGYKLLAQALAESLNGKAKDKVKTQLALTAQRAIYHLASSIYHAYIAYHPATPGVWREIHRLFNFAQHYSAATLEIEDQLNEVNGKSTVARIYKKAILLDLSGPYHLPGRSVQNINHCLDKWGDLASLSVATALPKDACQFLITKERDSSGEVYNGNTVDSTRMKDYLVLNTLQLARHVHSRLKSIHAGQVPEEDGIKGGVFTEENSRELLGKLVTAWGINPKRNFRRVSRKGDTINAALGIEAINFWLNGGETLVLSSEFVGPMPQKSKVGTLYMQADDQAADKPISVELEKNPDLHYVDWDVIDESAGGLAIATARPRHQRTKVGDMMGIRGGENGHWEIAVIRWIKTADQETVSVGLQRLAPHAVAVAINVLDAEGKDTKFKPALLLPTMPALKQPATIVAEKSSVSIGSHFFVDNGFQLSEAKVTKIIESTSAFERFEFNITQSR